MPRYARLTRQVEALIASACLAGTSTRRVKRALAPLFKGAAGKDVVSRAWRKASTDWTAWLRRDLAGEDVVRLILGGTVVRARLDRRATSISLLVARRAPGRAEPGSHRAGAMGSRCAAVNQEHGQRGGLCWTIWSRAGCARLSS